MKWKRVLAVTVALVAIVLFVSNIPQAAYYNCQAITGTYQAKVYTLAEDLNSFFEELGISLAELYAVENYSSPLMKEWHVDLVKVIPIREWVWDPITPTTFYTDAGGHQHGVQRGHWAVTHNLTRLQASIDDKDWIHWCPGCGPNADPTSGQRSSLDTFEEDLRRTSQPKSLITESVRHLKWRLRKEYQEKQVEVKDLVKNPHLDGAGRRLLDRLDALGRQPYELKALKGTRIPPTEQLARSITLYLNDHLPAGVVNRYQVRATGAGRFSISGWKHSGTATTSTIRLHNGSRIGWADLFDEVCSWFPISLPSPDLRLAVVVGDDPNRNQLADAIDETISAGRLYVMADRYNRTSYTQLFHFNGADPPRINEYHTLWVCSQEDRQGWELTRYERDVLAAWLKAGGTLIIGGLDSSDPAKRQETWLPTEAYSQFYPISLCETTPLDGWDDSGDYYHVELSNDAGYVGKGMKVTFYSDLQYPSFTVRKDFSFPHPFAPGIHIPFYNNLSFYYRFDAADSESTIHMRISVEYYWEDGGPYGNYAHYSTIDSFDLVSSDEQGIWRRYSNNALKWAQSEWSDWSPDYISGVEIHLRDGDLEPGIEPGDVVCIDEVSFITQRDYNLEPYLDMDVHDGRGYGDSCEVYTWESVMSGADDVVGWTTQSLNGST
ncbi:MAG: hypothetical protein ACFFDP_10810, partial [Promethearchaeota archaeon]